ncbi:hypothetical protein BBJ28_00019854 [Nothophytophthora sp. Chile5]|nr:hypothetical protein BBJ28_00019854 [Nothophytophthora sp. Chile5]
MTADRRMLIAALCEPAACDEADDSVPPLAPGGRAASKKRSRRLSNSERGKLYRSRRKTYVQTLEEQVEELKREVDELHLHQRAVVPLAREPVSSSFARVVGEYFALFEHGVPVGNASSEQVLRSSRQTSYLHGLMHPKMVFGSSYGVQTLLDQWEKYSMYHAALKYEVKSLQIMVGGPNPVVLAPATLHVRFTRRTVENIFPHVLWNEAFVQRLVGLQVEYPVGNTFYFGADNKILRYDTWVDFVAAFVKTLGIQDCMELLKSALIQHDAMIGELLEEPSIKLEEESGLPRVELVESDSSEGSEGLMKAERGAVGARIGMSLRGIL